MTSPAAIDTASVLTVTRGLQVLRAFRSDRTPVSNAELVRRTGLSKSTVSRLTSTLLQLGFLRRVPGGREFALATGALAMGHAFVTNTYANSVSVSDIAERKVIATVPVSQGPNGISMMP